MEEEVDCFKECALYKGVDNGGKCPFVELKNCKPFNNKNISEYDLFNDDKTSPLRMLYK
jgi:hypothetical protein